MPPISYNNLPTGTPEEQAVTKEVAEDINAVIQSSADDVRGRIGAILHLPINQVDAKAAATEIKAVYEQLAKKETLVTMFETVERIALYQADVVEKLRGTFTNTDVAYNVIGSIGELRRAAREAMAVAPHQQQQVEKKQEETKDKNDEDHTPDGKEKPPKYMKTWNPLNKDFRTLENWKPWGRRSAVIGGTLGLAGALASAETGAVIGQFPGVSTLAAIGAPIKAALAAFPALNTAWASWIPGFAGIAVPTALTLGTAWVAGRGYEWLESTKWFQETFRTKAPPARSFSNRVWKGLTALPRIAGRTVQYAWETAVANKKYILGGATIAGILALMGFAPPVGAAVIGTGLAIAAKATEGKEGGDAPAAPAGH